MKRSYIIGLVVIAIAVVVIISAIGNTSQYVVFKEATENPGNKYHVIGTWDKEKPVEYDAKKDPNYFAFFLKDSLSGEKKVIYHKAKPAEFEHSEKIVVVGQMNGENFEASEILMKCPSKYTSEKPITKEK